MPRRRPKAWKEAPRRNSRPVDARGAARQASRSYGVAGGSRLLPSADPFLCVRCLPCGGKRKQRVCPRRWRRNTLSVWLSTHRRWVIAFPISKAHRLKRITCTTAHHSHYRSPVIADAATALPVGHLALNPGGAPWLIRSRRANTGRLTALKNQRRQCHPAVQILNERHPYLEILPDRVATRNSLSDFSVVPLTMFDSLRGTIFAPSNHGESQWNRRKPIKAIKPIKVVKAVTARPRATRQATIARTPLARMIGTGTSMTLAIAARSGTAKTKTAAIGMLAVIEIAVVRMLIAVGKVISASRRDGAKRGEGTSNSTFCRSNPSVCRAARSN